MPNKCSVKTYMPQFERQAVLYGIKITDIAFCKYVVTVNTPPPAHTIVYHYCTTKAFPWKRARLVPTSIDVDRVQQHTDVCVC